MKDEGGQWLTRYISAAGVCSRRKAVALIQSGSISVNNHPVTSPVMRIFPGDRVTLGNTILRAESQVVVLLNKPVGCVSTVCDPAGRRTVVDLLGNCFAERLYPIGRLDYESSGVLLLTNNGHLAMQLAHPSFGVRKKYLIHLNKPLQRRDLLAIQRGIHLEDGPLFVDAVYQEGSTGGRGVCVELHSGRNRVLRRLFAALGYGVVSLERVGYGGLEKEGLAPGEWRRLTAAEVQKLSAAAYGYNHCSGR